MMSRPTKFTRRLFLQSNITQNSCVSILHRDLGMKPYRKQNIQELTDANKCARVSAAQIFIELVHMESDILFMFSDETTVELTRAIESSGLLSTQDKSLVWLDPSFLKTACIVWSRIGSMPPNLTTCRI